LSDSSLLYTGQSETNLYEEFTTIKTVDGAWSETFLHKPTTVGRPASIVR